MHTVCFLCAPLLLPWLGEVQGASLAMIQGKESPVTVHIPMFRVSTVLLRVPSAVPPTVVGTQFVAAPSQERAIATR